MSRLELINKLTLELSLAGSPTAEIDARVIICYSLSKSYENIIANGDEPITNAEYAKTRRLVRRRKKGEPIAYIVKNKEFYGYNFYVNKNVLIPRPETETLVENALNFIEQKIKNKKISRTKKINIIDIGTGSGCIIISLIKSLNASSQHKIDFFASDISKKALMVAKKNALNHQIYDNIRFYNSDLFANTRLPKYYDLIIANLPYLKPASKNNNYKSAHTLGLNWEPDIALYAPKNGFEIIERLIKILPLKLTQTGIALLETNDSQHKMIGALCAKHNLQFSRIDNFSGWNNFYKILRK